MTDEQDTGASISPQARALSLYIQSAVESLQASFLDGKKASTEQGSLIYLGNWQDPYPRLLVTDPVLEPVDKLVWQIIRLHISAPGSVTAFPNYEIIRTYANIRSNHTISRALAILRATRWLSLCARVRDGRGRYLGNIYVLHDEPVTLGDAMYLDTEYMTFLQTGVEHSHSRVRKIIANIVATIEELVDNGQDVMGERIQTRSYERRIGAIPQTQTEPTLQLAERTEFYAISDSRINTLAKDEDNQNSTQEVHTDDGSDDHVQILHTAHDTPSSLIPGTHKDQYPENLHVQKTHKAVESKNSQVQKLHTDLLHSSSNNINITTTTSSNTPRACEEHQLHFPANISANERELAMMYLSAMNETLQQDVLDEWNGRLSAAHRRSMPIENPMGYLAGLCRRAKKDEFQITIGIQVREKREREATRKVEDKHREKREKKRHEEYIQSLQQKTRSTEKSKITQRLSQIHQRNKNSDKS